MACIKCGDIYEGRVAEVVGDSVRIQDVGLARLSFGDYPRVGQTVLYYDCKGQRYVLPENDLGALLPPPEDTRRDGVFVRRRLEFFDPWEVPVEDFYQFFQTDLENTVISVNPDNVNETYSLTIRTYNAMHQVPWLPRGRNVEAPPVAVDDRFFDMYTYARDGDGKIRVTEDGAPIYTTTGVPAPLLRSWFHARTFEGEGLKSRDTLPPLDDIRDKPFWDSDLQGVLPYAFGIKDGVRYARIPQMPMRSLINRKRALAFDGSDGFDGEEVYNLSLGARHGYKDKTLLSTTKLALEDPYPETARQLNGYQPLITNTQTSVGILISILREDDSVNVANKSLAGRQIISTFDRELSYMIETATAYWRNNVSYIQKLYKAPLWGYQSWETGSITSFSVSTAEVFAVAGPAYWETVKRWLNDKFDDYWQVMLVHWNWYKNTSNTEIRRWEFENNASEADVSAYKTQKGFFINGMITTDYKSFDPSFRWFNKADDPNEFITFAYGERQSDSIIIAVSDYNKNENIYEGDYGVIPVPESGSGVTVFCGLELDRAWVNFCADMCVYGKDVYGVLLSPDMRVKITKLSQDANFSQAAPLVYDAPLTDFLDDTDALAAMTEQTGDTFSFYSLFPFAEDVETIRLRVPLTVDEWQESLVVGVDNTTFVNVPLLSSVQQNKNGHDLYLHTIDRSSLTRGGYYWALENTQFYLPPLTPAPRQHYRPLLDPRPSEKPADTPADEWEFDKRRMYPQPTAVLSTTAGRVYVGVEYENGGAPLKWQAPKNGVKYES